MESVGDFPTFPEAFKKFFEDLCAAMEAGASQMVVETCCWIECTVAVGDFPVTGPLYIHQLKKITAACNYIDDQGVLRDPLPDIPEGALRAITSIFALDTRVREFDRAGRALEAMQTGTPFVE